MNSPGTILRLMRPVQWLKNLMLFFPPFLAGHILVSGVVIRGVVPFIAFCLVSSAGYIFNDLIDRKRDHHHPQKRHRPISSGLVRIQSAALLSSALLIAGLALGSGASTRFVLLLSGYLLTSLLYTLFFKNIPVADLFAISVVFLIRLQAGGEIFAVPISPWLFVTVFLLAVFLSTGKRLSELCSLGNRAGEHRPSLARYPKGFLEGTLYMSGSAVLVTYAMYALNRHTLIYSVPLCLFGLLRYILRVTAGKGGDPTESLLKDQPLFVVGILWVAMVFWSIYL